MKELTIGANDAGQRLDKFVAKAVKKLPSSLIYKYIRLKRIKVNDKRATAEYMLVAGDNVKMYVNDEFFEASTDDGESFKKLEPKLNVVFEDENIIIMDKPKGMLTHSDESEDYNTLVNHMKA